MLLQEVQRTYFDYEDKKRQYILEVQAYFLKNKINPYVWLDEKHQLHIKIKFRRGQENIVEDIGEIHQLADKFAEREQLQKIWEEITTNIDPRLKEEVQSENAIEIIYRGVINE